MTAFLVPVLTVLLSVVLSFMAALYLGRRDLRRNERVTFLLRAYRDLADTAQRPPGENARSLEQALSDVGLLGEPEQVRLAAGFAHECAGPGTATLTPLLGSLRAELRRELGLSLDVPDMPILRMEQPPGGP
jgi:hypothetical protein